MSTLELYLRATTTQNAIHELDSIMTAPRIMEMTGERCSLTKNMSAEQKVWSRADAAFPIRLETPQARSTSGAESQSEHNAQLIQHVSYCESHPAHLDRTKTI